MRDQDLAPQGSVRKCHPRDLVLILGAEFLDSLLPHLRYCIRYHLELYLPPLEGYILGALLFLDPFHSRNLLKAREVPLPRLVESPGHLDLALQFLMAPLLLEYHIQWCFLEQC
jgi:hypothetical protein